MLCLGMIALKMVFNPSVHSARSFGTFTTVSHTRLNRAICGTTTARTAPVNGLTGFLNRDSHTFHLLYVLFIISMVTHHPDRTYALPNTTNFSILSVSKLTDIANAKAAHSTKGVSCHIFKFSPNCAGPHKHPSGDHTCSGHPKLPCHPELQSMLPFGLLPLHGS